MIKVSRLLCGVLSVVAVSVTIFYMFHSKKDITAEEEIVTLTLWQIDSFEGGTGSRSAYLQEKGNDYKKLDNEYINVVALSADAARLNIANGNTPDIISFGSSEWGLENLINPDYQVQCWCYGAYCLLAIGEDVDFTEANSENTVMNNGKDNLSQAAALMCGMEDAATQSSNYAYVDLINGKYKFLLGTPRDIYRLNARKVRYSIKPIEQFNDLYQLIAVCTDDTKRAEAANKFVEYLMDNKSDIYKLGLLGGDCDINEKIIPLEKINYELTLCVPISESTRNEIEKAIKLKDINKLKTLLK